MTDATDRTRESGDPLFDTSAIRDDESYWVALAERIAANAMIQSRATGLDWLARSGVAWVAAPLVLAAALVLVVLLPENASDRSSARWSDALAPKDAVARAMVSSERPPDITALLLSEENRE